jgi:hypothetical protein
MLTGSPPFSEGNPVQKVLQHVRDLPPDVRDHQPNIPPQVSQIIQKMMAKAPGARYQTASELVDDLTGVATMIGMRPVGSGSLIWELPLKRRFQPVLRHLPWLVPLILFVILTASVQIASFFGSQPDEGLFLVNGEGPGYLPQDATKPPVLPPHGNGTATVNNGGGVNGSTNGAIIALPPKFRLSDKIGTISKTPLENARYAASVTRVPLTRASLEIDSNPTNVLVAPVVAARYQMTVPQVGGGTSPSSGNNLPPKQLIVDPTGQQTNSFKTLTDAARAAASEATIELNFTGPVDIEFFRFSESKTTIKSGEGYRAKIVFRPPPSIGYTKKFCMAELTNSRLVFENVEIEMVIPQNIDTFASRMSMFDLIGECRVELNNVILTFNNAQRERTNQDKNAFFRCCPISTTTAGLPPTASGASSPNTPRTDLVVRNSLIRGEASLLRCDNSRAVLVDSNNVLIAINQPVFSLLDIKPSEVDNMITAGFSHNTIFAPAMVSWQPGTIGGTLGHPIALTLNDSIVRCNRESMTLAVYAGSITQPDVTGFYGRNSSRTFYQNFIRSWSVQPLQAGGSPREASPIELLDPLRKKFFETTILWENQYIDSIPVHNLTKNHFLLNKNSNNNNTLQFNDTYPGIKPESIPEPYNPYSSFYPF